MTYSSIAYDVSDAIATITLNRPEARNSITAEVHRELADVVARVLEDVEVKALILTGSGGSFCSGGDIKAMQGSNPSFAEDKLRFDRVHELLYRLIEMPKPVIAAVDGPAFGAGCNLALAADFILATPRAKFCQVFGRMGLVPDFGGLFLLPRIVGLQRAKELMFSARILGADEAKNLGIVFRLVSSDSLQTEARSLARRFCHASTVAIGMAKRALNRSFNVDFHVMSEFEASAQSRLRSDPYVREAVRRFNNKEQLEFIWEKFDSPAAEAIPNHV
ncbi:MAG: enoyl-CoA hydratase/isomerase family protein [Burkholderiales bacterium]|nr:enoyl-CoA hydratase/isomerase family protein [Burkholderiales bacterium]